MTSRRGFFGKVFGGMVAAIITPAFTPKPGSWRLNPDWEKAEFGFLPQRPVIPILYKRVKLARVYDTKPWEDTNA